MPEAVAPHAVRMLGLGALPGEHAVLPDLALQLGRLLGLGHGVLVEVDLHAADGPHQQHDDGQQQAKAYKKGREPPLAGKGHKTLKPAPYRDPARSRGVEERLGRCERVPVAAPPGRKIDRQHQGEQRVDRRADAAAHARVVRAQQVQAELYQLSEQHGQREEQDQAQRRYEPKPEVYRQVRQLQQHIESGKHRHADLCAETEHQHTLRLHRRGEQQRHIGRLENRAAVFFGAQRLIDKQREDGPTGDQLKPLRELGRSYRLLVDRLLDLVRAVLLGLILEHRHTDADQPTAERTDQDEHDHPGAAELADLVP